MRKTSQTVLAVAVLANVSCVNLVWSADYQPELFSSVELIYDEQFAVDGPHENTKQWVIRQNTRWNVKDGILVGEIADEEFQKKMQAKGDGHDGTRPVIFLKPVPKAFVVQMRVRYTETAKKGRNRGSLLDLGHHVNSFIFGEAQTKLTLQKKKKIFIEGDFFPLNQWNDLTLEIKEGIVLANREVPQAGVLRKGDNSCRTRLLVGSRPDPRLDGQAARPLHRINDLSRRGCRADLGS